MTTKKPDWIGFAIGVLFIGVPCGLFVSSRFFAAYPEHRDYILVVPVVIGCALLIYARVRGAKTLADLIARNPGSRRR